MSSCVISPSGELLFLRNGGCEYQRSTIAKNTVDVENPFTNTAYPPPLGEITPRKALIWAQQWSTIVSSLPTALFTLFSLTSSSSPFQLSSWIHFLSLLHSAFPQSPVQPGPLYLFTSPIHVKQLSKNSSRRFSFSHFLAGNIDSLTVILPISFNTHTKLVNPPPFLPLLFSYFLHFSLS